MFVVDASHVYFSINFQRPLWGIPVCVLFGDLLLKAFPLKSVDCEHPQSEQGSERRAVRYNDYGGVIVRKLDRCRLD